jgi:enoyl-CoA hydratase/carnithine racemase
MKRTPHNDQGASMLVRYETDGDIAFLTLDRPDRLNAVNPALANDLCLALEKAISDQVGVAILAGEGRSFCAGYDLKREQEDNGYETRRQNTERTQDVMRLVRSAPFPIIAAVQGYALGAGCEFAFCSDLIVAADDATFGFPEVGVGLSITGGISYILPLAVGMARAKELVLLGEFFSARKALEMGLINQVVPSGELSSAAVAMARKLALQPRLALHFAKRVLDSGPQGGLAEALQLESLFAMTTLGSDDALQASARFRTRHST